MATTLETGRLDLKPQRWTPYVFDIDFEDMDFTGATMALQVRTARDMPGSPLLSLTNATAGSEGLSVTTNTVGGVTTSTVTIHVSEAMLEALLPFPANGLEPGTDVALKYDLHVTSDGLKQRWLEGDFTIVAGVTQ